MYIYTRISKIVNDGTSTVMIKLVIMHVIIYLPNGICDILCDPICENQPHHQQTFVAIYNLFLSVKSFLSIFFLKRLFCMFIMIVAAYLSLEHTTMTT